MIPGQEPAAVFRQSAATYRQMYLALREQDFNDKQALEIIGYMIMGASEAPPPPDPGYPGPI